MNNLSKSWKVSNTIFYSFITKWHVAKSMFYVDDLWKGNTTLQSVFCVLWRCQEYWLCNMRCQEFVMVKNGNNAPKGWTFLLKKLYFHIINASKWRTKAILFLSKWTEIPDLVTRQTGCIMAVQSKVVCYDLEYKVRA